MPLKQADFKQCILVPELAALARKLQKAA